jgi:CRP/FNR family transcriptional regulator, cyclic AMP receptor protein
MAVCDPFLDTDRGKTGEAVVGFENRFRAASCMRPVAGLSGPGSRIRYLLETVSRGEKDCPTKVGYTRWSSCTVKLSLGEGGLMGKRAKDSFDPKIFLAKVGAGKTILKFHRNQNVFAQGDVADTIYYVQKGRIKLTVLSEQGKEAVVAILEPGQFFGEGCLNAHPLRLATTTAMEECLITSITKEAMISLLHEEPKFSELFMAYLLTRNSRVEEDLIDQLFNSSEKRLARLLLLLAHFGKEGSPQPINPNISQETLAEMIGTTRSRVSFFMNKFRKLGLISYNGKIEVHNSLLSAVLHDKPEIERDGTTGKK